MAQERPPVHRRVFFFLFILFLAVGRRLRNRKWWDFVMFPTYLWAEHGEKQAPLQSASPRMQKPASPGTGAPKGGAFCAWDKCVAEVWNEGESGSLRSPLFNALIPCWLPRRLTAGIVDVSTVYFRVTNPTKLPLKLLISFSIRGSSLECCGWFYWRAIEIFF